MSSSNSSVPLSSTFAAASASLPSSASNTASASTLTATSESLSTSAALSVAPPPMSSASSSSTPSSLAPSSPPSSVSASSFASSSASASASTPPPPPSSSSTTTTTTTSSTTTTTSSTTTTTSASPPPTSNPTRSSPDPSTSLAQSAPTETLASTVFVITTDSAGHTTTSTPIIITTVVTLTSNGLPVTTTEIKLNPTLSPDGHSSGGSAFFKNTGAVAGVFVLVGLAAAAIVLWVLFGLRRRRRNRRMEHDTAVSATLAAAGFHRAPLDDDELRGNGSRGSRGFATPEMEMLPGVAAGGTRSSVPSAGRNSGYLDTPGHDEAAFNPYQDYVVAGPTEGYIPARTSSPPPSAFVEPYRDASGHTVHHSASQSVGSTEPLLAAFDRTEPASLDPSAPPRPSLEPPTPPPRNPKRMADRHSQISGGEHANPRPENRRHSTASSVYSSESTDERLNPALRNSDIQDSEDYSRPVLGVRNFPDGLSQVSGES
ncbi:hypothetical protein C8F04DRAFT_373072 [Mycena alexandri]|uniref:Uncharacterized protein n=1 Tax=Mycena alexandri TaxID=1745969 RepID=A0AAD6T1Z5_9AGAR|nr:hypothetical protein C8F04DRAFT_373072 [Mycena alexandri]